MASRADIQSIIYTAPRREMVGGWGDGNVAIRQHALAGYGSVAGLGTCAVECLVRGEMELFPVSTTRK